MNYRDFDSYLVHQRNGEVLRVAHSLWPEEQPRVLGRVVRGLLLSSKGALCCFARRDCRGNPRHAKPSKEVSGDERERNSRRPLTRFGTRDCEAEGAKEP